MNDVFERLSARMNNNEIFERLSARLDDMPAAKQAMGSSYEESVAHMRAKHAARVAEMENRHANDVADIDSWWNEVCEKHAAAEAAMEAKHKEAEAKPASSVGNNEQAIRLFGEQHRLFMEQADRDHEQAIRLFHQ